MRFDALSEGPSLGLIVNKHLFSLLQPCGYSLNRADLRIHIALQGFIWCFAVYTAFGRTSGLRGCGVGLKFPTCSTKTNCTIIVSFCLVRIVDELIYNRGYQIYNLK